MLKYIIYDISYMKSVIYYKSEVLLFTIFLITLIPCMWQRDSLLLTFTKYARYIAMLSIGTGDNNDAIKQNGDNVEFSFNAMVYRWVTSSFNDIAIQLINFRIVTNTVSVMMEPAQPMSCSVSKNFESENRAEINNTSVASLNATFELSAQDISLVSYKIFWKKLLRAPCPLWGMWQGVALSLRRDPFLMVRK